MSAWIVKWIALRPSTWLGLLGFSLVLGVFNLGRHEWHAAFVNAFAATLYVIAWAYAAELKKAQR